MTRLYLAADGGNSKTDVILGDTGGAILGWARGGTSSPHNIGLDGGIAVLDRLVREAHAAAGIPYGTEIDLVAAFLAGADLPIEIQRLTEAVDAAGWARESIVENDCFAMLRAGTAAPDAVVVVCGAGNNAAGRAADGRTSRFPALGPLSGDWGGGHDLADFALRAAVRGEDGRGAPTGLSAAVAAHFGKATVEDVILDMHFAVIPVERLRELTPVLFAIAATGDAVASALVTRQATEILAQHRVAAGRLGLLGLPHAVVLGGGVLQARHPQLHAQVIDGLRAQAPLATVSVLGAPPVTGAALSALDRLGAADAEPRLRGAVDRQWAVSPW